jgi:DNA-directed RNA polymerase specialized sigma24 family protein
MNRGMSQVAAEECQIDVFTKVWETKYPRPGNNPQRYDPEHAGAGSFRTWLYRIALNHWKDQKKPTLLFSEMEARGGAQEGSTFDPAVLQPDLYANRVLRPDEEITARQHQAAVHDCHDALPPRPKFAITVWLEHRGVYGIGNILVEELKAHFPGQGISAATASTLLAKARELMKDCLERKGVDVSWSW